MLSRARFSSMTGLLSTADIATRYDVDESTARLWCKQRKFPNAKRVGRDWIVPESDLANFVKPPMGRPPKPETEAPAKATRKKKGK